LESVARRIGASGEGRIAQRRRGRRGEPSGEFLTTDFTDKHGWGRTLEGQRGNPPTLRFGATRAETGTGNLTAKSAKTGSFNREIREIRERFDGMDKMGRWLKFLERLATAATADGRR
jgi:hypothetical protein